MDIELHVEELAFSIRDGGSFYFWHKRSSAVDAAVAGTTTPGCNCLMDGENIPGELQKSSSATFRVWTGAVRALTV